MTTPRHLAYFLALGLFWGVSPSFYREWSLSGVPVTHVITLTGLSVAVALAVMAWLRFGRAVLTREVMLYGLGCAALMNLPFASTLYLAHYVPPTELALAISTAPLASYVLALLTGRDSATPRRLAAIGFGLLSTIILIISREGGPAGVTFWWYLVLLALPVLYAFYNWFTARRAPPVADIYSLGASESVWSGLLALPFLLWLDPPWANHLPAISAYWTIAVVSLMWVVERIAYFTLIREKGAVYTVQATYVSTPAAVIIAAVFYGGAADKWLWVSLAVLMLALWLNNTGKVVQKSGRPE